MPTHPFHYAFYVSDLERTREFYVGLLECREGRSAATWIDFDLYGNQLSAHTGGDVAGASETGYADAIAPRMPHFGCILPWDEFRSLADRLRAAAIRFVLEPTIRFEGLPGEQATMFFLDPSGNALEFKSFRHPEHVFTAHEPTSEPSRQA